MSLAAYTVLKYSVLDLVNGQNEVSELLIPCAFG